MPESLKKKTQMPLSSSVLDALIELPLSSQLATLRKLKGISQEKMASDLKVKQGYLSRLENGLSDHRLSSYQKEAKYLGVRIIALPFGAKIVSR